MIDTSAYLDELAAALASHTSAFAAIQMTALEQKVAPSMPPVPKPPVVTMGGDVSLAGAYGAAAAVLGAGDASDDDVVEAVDTVLTRDMYFRSYTINAGVTVNAAGFRVFATEEFTNNGILHNNGGDGEVTGGHGIGGGAGTVGGGAVGGDGGTGAGVAGDAVGDSLGGSGGDGGFETYSGGVLGDAYPPSPTKGNLHDLSTALSGRLLDGTQVGGGGGGGGGGGSGVLTGGGGGGGGGVLVVAARTINNTNGVISCNGGAGGDVAATGGGGGGGGGVLILISVALTSGVEQAAGGVGGASGSAGDGSAGAAGLVVKSSR